jgi:hypothetical protein
MGTAAVPNRAQDSELPSLYYCMGFRVAGRSCPSIVRFLVAGISRATALAIATSDWWKVADSACAKIPRRNAVNLRRHMRTARIIALCCFVSLLLLPQAGLGQRERGWELLGTAHVDGAADHDNIKVERGEQFRQIQLRVRGGAIEFRRVVVHYGNGASEEVQVRQRIPGGGQTRAIDLRGERPPHRERGAMVRQGALAATSDGRAVRPLSRG